MTTSLLTSNPPEVFDSGGCLVDELVRHAAVTTFVPTLLELGRAVEMTGHRAELRFRRDENGRISSGVEVHAVNANKPTRATMTIMCVNCLEQVRVNVIIDPETHPCRCAPACPPERLSWRAAAPAVCSYCETVYPVDALVLSADLDDAVQEGREARGDWNPRYVAYSLENGRDPEQMLEHDRDQYPGGVMCGYILWIGQRWHEWRTRERIAADAPLSRADHARFDAWLVSRAAS